MQELRASMGSLVGRERECASLSEVIVGTVRGVGERLVMTGAAGIGKTRLLDVAAREARRAGLFVALGRAMELDRATPMITLRRTLGTCRTLALAMQRRGEDSVRTAQDISQLGEIIADRAVRKPVVIFIDDTQWADEGSAAALRVLVAALRSSPVTWVFARRPPTQPSPGQDLVAWLLATGARTISLGPLDQTAARQLWRSMLRARPDQRLLALLIGGGGNPLLIEQLLGALRSARRLVITGGVASMVGDDLPADFVAAVGLRLGELTDATNELLRAASIFGRAFTVHEVAQLLGVPASGLVSSAEEAVAAAILQEQGSRLAFCHDVVREVVYDGITAPIRATRHREAVAVVLAEGGPVVEAAYHVMRGDPGGGPEAVALLRRAAAGLAGVAPRTAADYLVRALQTLDRQDPGWPELCAQAVSLLVSAGHMDDARRYSEEALGSGLDPPTRALLLLGLAEGLKHQGHNRASVEHADRALRIEGVPADIQALLHGVRAHALLYVDDGAGADDAGARADRLGRVSRCYAASVLGDTARSVVARNEGRLGDALAYARSAVETATHHGGATLHRHPRLWLGSALAALDMFADASAAYTLVQHEAARLGTTWSQPLAHFHRAALLAAKGQLDDAVAEAEAGLDVADSYGARQLCVPLRGLLASIAVTRNHLPVAREQLRQLELLLSTGITAAPELVAWPIAMLHEAEGEWRLALTSLAQIYDQLPRRLLLFSHDPGCAPAMVRIALAAGDPTRAQVTVAAARLMAERNPTVVSLAGAALHAEGLLHGDLAALAAAIACLRRSPRPFLRAAALEDAANAEHDTGSRSQAVDHLAEALDVYITHGARRGVERLRRRRTVVGVTRLAEEREATTDSPLACLTPTEREVARWVAEGMTNKAIGRRLSMAPHTVDRHLRRIFDKLRINSRVELTRIVATEDGGRSS